MLKENISAKTSLRGNICGTTMKMVQTQTMCRLTHCGISFMTIYGIAIRFVYKTDEDLGLLGEHLENLWHPRVRQLKPGTAPDVTRHRP